MIKVNIVVPVYNQEKFISQAIQSILDQKCDFNYSVLIGDDHSTDGTGEICKAFQKKYPERILYIRNKENMGLAKNYQVIFNKCFGKYIAILEGDDYWIDKRKLQKQVEILESNPEVGLVHTGSYTLFENGDMKKNHLNVPRNMLDGKLYKSLLLKRNTISPMTVCFRRSIFEKYVNFAFFVQNDFKTIDYPMWLELAQHSKFAYIKEATAVYRNLSTSVSHNGNFEQRVSFYETAEMTKLYYLRKYPAEGITERQLLNKINKTHFNLAVEFKRYDKANEIREKLLLTNLESRLMYLFSSNIVLFRIFSAWFNLKPALSKVKQLVYKFHNK